MPTTATTKAIWTELAGPSTHKYKYKNTTEPSMYGGNAACCQITLTMKPEVYSGKDVQNRRVLSQERDSDEVTDGESGELTENDDLSGVRRGE